MDVCSAERPWMSFRRCFLQILLFYAQSPRAKLRNGQTPTKKKKLLILKTIGNRKGDCAWSCSRWQNTPWENLQIATHKSVSFTLHIVLICALQFPIVFGINLIPFFDICAVLVMLFFSTRLFGYVLLYMCCFTWAAARSQQLLFVVLAAGLWCLTAGCHVKSLLSPQPPLKQKSTPRSRWEKAYIQVRPSSFSQSNALRE